MAIIRNNLRKKFSTIPNQIITDTNLSHGAVRIFCYLATKHDEWEVNNSDIRKQLQIKDKGTLAKYWNELIKNGWLSRERKVNESKKFIGGYDYELHFDKKTIEIRKNPSSEKPELGNTPPLNTTKIFNTTELLFKDIDSTFLILDERIKDTLLNQSFKVAYYLYYKILENKPNFVCRNIRTWQKDILLAISKDGRKYQELINCINYIYSEKGSFWIPNIMSGKKLREKFDTIEMQSLQQTKPNNTISNIDKVFKLNEMGVI